MFRTVLAALVLFLPVAMARTEEKPEEKKKIEVGKPAPDFTLKDEKGKEVKLSSFKGKKNVLLAFYPRDFTGGCTAELKGFRDEHETFVKSEVQLLGISTDPVDSHQKFCDSLKLPFPLLADDGGKVSTLYGILIKRDKDLLSGRSVFLIDKEGIVRHADADYQLKGDDHDHLLKAVGAMAKPEKKK
jgi:peroxiredoxin Q/BCP